MKVSNSENLNTKLSEMRGEMDHFFHHLILGCLSKIELRIKISELYSTACVPGGFQMMDVKQLEGWIQNQFCSWASHTAL